MPFIDPDRSGITLLKIFAIEFIAIAIVFGLLSVF